MEENYSNEVKGLIEKYKKGGIVYGKPLDILLSRIKSSKKEVEEEVFTLKNLEFVEKQIKDYETRYSLFFVYGGNKGRIYVITFRDKNIRIITIFPLGRKSLRKYRKKFK